MNTDRTFTNVDDKVLVNFISQASQRVMFVAPGLRNKKFNPHAKSLTLGESMLFSSSVQLNRHNLIMMVKIPVPQNPESADKSGWCWLERFFMLP
jgi:hypothetical protein